MKIHETESILAFSENPPSLVITKISIKNPIIKLAIPKFFLVFNPNNVHTSSELILFLNLTLTQVPTLEELCL